MFYSDTFSSLSQKQIISQPTVDHVLNNRFFFIDQFHDSFNNSIFPEIKGSGMLSQLLCLLWHHLPFNTFRVSPWLSLVARYKCHSAISTSRLCWFRVSFYSIKVIQSAMAVDQNCLQASLQEFLVVSIKVLTCQQRLATLDGVFRFSTYTNLQA